MTTLPSPPATIRLCDASFDDATLGLSGTATDDGQTLSLLFDGLHVDSGNGTPDPGGAPGRLRCAEGLVRATGPGWVTVQMRGSKMSTGPHGWAQAMGWANGRALRSAAAAEDELFATAAAVPLDADGQLRLSLLLLAQHDRGVAGSAAGCWVDSLDLQIVPGPEVAWHGGGPVARRAAEDGRAQRGAAARDCSAPRRRLFPAWPLRTVAAGVAVAVLAGCTTVPLERWTPSQPPATAGASMDGALAYLDSARTVYRQAVVDQLGQERGMSNALLLGGALVAALAVGKVHRDAIIGTSFLAGTGYALGSQNLQRPRVMVYQAGVEALNCAERAVAPFAMAAKESRNLEESLDTLFKRRQAVVSALAAAQAMRDRAGVLPASRGALDLDVLAPAARAALQSSDTTLRAGHELLSATRIGARQLVAAVNTIDAAVARAVTAQTADLSSVPKVLAGLAGMIGAFAPGAGIEEVVKQRLEGVAEQKSNVDAPDLLAAANATLREAIVALASSQSAATALLAGRTAAWPADAFKDCGVEQVVAPLSVSPVSVQLTAERSARRTLDISGGVKPYFVELDGPTPEGLTVRSPTRFDSRAEILVDATKLKSAVQTELRVIDSSPTARSQVVQITVVAPATTTRSTMPNPPADAPVNKDPAGTSGAAAGGAATGPASASPANALRDSVNRVTQLSIGGAIYLHDQQAAVSGGSVTVRLRCTQGVAAPQADVRKELLRTAGVPPQTPQVPLNIEIDAAACRAS